LAYCSVRCQAAGATSSSTVRYTAARSVTTSAGVSIVDLMARSKNRRAAAASRRCDTNTSMTCPNWSVARHIPPLASDLDIGLIESSRRSSGDVYDWLNDPVIPTPVELLREHGHLAAASSLQGRQNGAPETRDGVYETARTAAQCMRDPQIMAWVTRPRRSGLAELDPPALVESQETLYLLSKDGAGAAAPQRGAT